MATTLTQRIPGGVLPAPNGPSHVPRRAALAWAVLLLVTVFGADALLSHVPLVLLGILDEGAHLATTVVAVLAVHRMGLCPGPRFALVALAAGMLIDLDHLPLVLSGSALTAAERPESHSVITVALVAFGVGVLVRAASALAATPPESAAAAAASGTPDGVVISARAERRALAVEVGAAVALGMAVHLVRDAATGGVPLFWPLSGVVLPLPYSAYVLLLIVGVVGWLRTPTWPVRRRRVTLSVAASRIIVALAAFLFAAVVAGGMLTRYDNLRLAGYDTGIFAQGMWLLSTGADPFVTVRGLPIFGDHASFILYAFVPIYAILPDPRVLLIAQSIGMAAPAIALNALFLDPRALTGFRRERGAAAEPTDPWTQETEPASKPVRSGEAIRSGEAAAPPSGAPSGAPATPPAAVIGAATVFPILYLLHPATQGAATFEFHPETLAPGLLVLGMHLALRGTTRWWPLPLVLAALCKEDVSLILVGMGILLFLRGRRRPGISLALVAAAYFAIATSLLIPWLSGHQSSVYFGALYGLKTTSGPFGWLSGLPKVLDTALRVAFTDRGMAYLALILGPVAFLPLLDAIWLLPVAAPLLLNLAARREAMQTVNFHYLATSTVFITAAAFFGYLAWRRRTMLRHPQAALALLLCLGLAFTGLRGRMTLMATDMRGTPPATKATGYAALALIPAQAPVSASWNLVPQLANRTEIYDFPVPFDKGWWGPGPLPRHRIGAVRYVLLQPSRLRDIDRAAYQQILRQPGWVRLVDRDDILLLRRDGSGPTGATSSPAPRPTAAG